MLGVETRYAGMGQNKAVLRHVVERGATRRGVRVLLRREWDGWDDENLMPLCLHFQRTKTSQLWGSMIAEAE